MVVRNRALRSYSPETRAARDPEEIRESCCDARSTRGRNAQKHLRGQSGDRIGAIHAGLSARRESVGYAACQHCVAERLSGRMRGINKRPVLGRGAVERDDRLRMIEGSLLELHASVGELEEEVDERNLFFLAQIRLQLRVQIEDVEVAVLRVGHREIAAAGVEI